MSKLSENIKFKIQGSKNSGFSLMEVMMAIFIILVGLVGVMALISKSITAGSQSASRLIAANLAQEGIEVVKNIRELNYDPATGWDTWHANIINGTYSVQYDSQVFGSSANNFLYFHASTGLYDYNAGGGTLSPLRRSITLTRMSASSTDVISTVTWTERGNNKSVIVEDILWNWR